MLVKETQGGKYFYDHSLARFTPLLVAGEPQGVSGRIYNGGNDAANANVSDSSVDVNLKDDKPDNSTIGLVQRKTVDAGFAGPTVEAVEISVKAVVERIGLNSIPVNVDSTNSDLPAHVLAAAREQGADGQLYAVHDASTVHIVTDKMQSENRSKSKVANTWLLTGDKDKSGETKEGFDSFSPTHSKPTPARQAVGADKANTSKIIRVRNKPCENGPLRTLIKIERLIRPKRQRAGFHKAREF